MSWHIDDRVIARYRAGALPPSLAASTESHVLDCAACRTALNASVAAALESRLDRLWDDITDRVDRPSAGPVERLLRRLGVREDLGRLLAATPSLQRSWLLGIASTLAIAVLLAHGGDGEVGRFTFLVLAPVLPVLGVAAAFGPRVDPAREVAVAAPMHGMSLLVLRSVAVVATTMAVAGVAAVVLPGAGWHAAAWLLPALALSTATLALATWHPPVASAVGVATTWATVSALSLRGAQAGARFHDDLVDRMLVLRPSGQFTSFLIIVAAVAVLVHRRDALELGRLP